MMARDRQTEAQLSMMASAADRANRPRMIVVVCLLLAGAALILVLAMVFRFTSARSLLEQRLTEKAGVELYVQKTEQLPDQRVDFASMFPDNPSIGDQIAQIADSVTGPQPADKINVGQPQYKGITLLLGGGDPRLQEVNVRCTFTQVRTEHLLEWMERVQNTPSLSGTFVTSVEISPRDPGRWTGSVQFRRYVYRENAR
ncbi:MAG: hypothetical protein Tsb0013_15530 [Phycisphaerales bacterium]